MTDLEDHLRRYLQRQRDSLLLKLDGLPERELRLPRTPTGTNLLGIVKHCLNCEYGYFGPTFGRTMSDPALIADEQYDADPQADFYATEDETADGLIDLYRRVQAFADETIAELPLDAVGRVPWWTPDRGRPTLGQLLSYVSLDLARHAGQADILREQIDGAVGWWGPGDNVPPGYDWAAYVDKLTRIADRF
jgi:uncharacterized damage-inducible protein DinB